MGSVQEGRATASVLASMGVFLMPSALQCPTCKGIRRTGCPPSPEATGQLCIQKNGSDFSAKACRPQGRMLLLLLPRCCDSDHCRRWTLGPRVRTVWTRGPPEPDGEIEPAPWWFWVLAYPHKTAPQLRCPQLALLCPVEEVTRLFFQHPGVWGP